MREWTMQLPRELRRSGTAYRIEVIGVERSDHTWEGRLRFSDDAEKSVTTGEETSQPNREALEYWATGLEIVYLEGALQRAIDAAGRGGSS